MKSWVAMLAAVITVSAVTQIRAGDAKPPEAPVALISPAPVAVRSSTSSPVGLPAKNVKEGQKLTYTLVSPPSHGTLVLTAARVENSSHPATAYYTSNQDYVGTDSFSWKVAAGSAESNTVTVSIQVTAAVPNPDVQTVCVFQDTALDIPAAYTGGGGFNYTLKSVNPEHGTLTVNGTTFHYAPAAGYSGSDAFAWTMSYTQKDGKGGPASSRSVVCYLVVKPPNMKDWPQWRADEWRSGFTTMKLPETLSLQWRREFTPTRTPFAARGAFPDIDNCRPVQLGKNIFVPSTASDSLSAYNTDSGELKWRFYASGAVRRPAAAFELKDKTQAVLFGSDDGYVYCLNAADGSLRWKFRAAPNNRMAIGFGRLSSVWPIWASPVVSGDRVYLAAGYIPEFGLYAYCLDAATGAVRWVNDGRISDMWNTSTLGPLTLSYDGKHILGSVEGAARPWVISSADGEFLGHEGVGFKFAGSGHQGGDETKRNGSRGWFGDGTGAQNVLEPLSITVGSQTFTPEKVAALGVSGTVASLLAGDGKLFVTTTEGNLYCFGGTLVEKPKVHSLTATPLPETSDNWTTVAKTMLSRDDLKQGLALVLGLGNGADRGRLVEELAKQSTLMIVAVDADRNKLQALRAKMDAAGLSGARVATLEGRPLDFTFSPYISALITSEDAAAAGLNEKPASLETLYLCTRPFGGEIWLPSSEAQHSAFADFAANSKNMPLSEIKRAGNYTQFRRNGLPAEKLKLKPPLGLVAFGSEQELAASSPPQWHWTNRDVYTWIPMKGKISGTVPAEPKYSDQKGYPSPDTVSTKRSIFTSMTNPLYGEVEKFGGVPSSGNDGACTALFTRYGDFGLTPGKMASFFDSSADYWGRLFFTEAGGCPGNMLMRNGVIVVMANPVPGITCGCSAAMQFSCFSLASMENEETWINYQTARTSNPIEELPIRQIGINFGAPGDRYEDGLLWTHHPFFGRYGRDSYNFECSPEALPLVPVSYRGPVLSIYHHSAQMEKSAHGWVAASQVKGMTGLTVHLAQPAVALRATTAPKIDGDLSDECWKGAKRLVFAVNKTVVDRDKDTGPPKADEHCYAMLRYDDANLYVAAGAHVTYGPAIPWRTIAVKSMTVTLNSRERLADDVVLTGSDNTEKGKQSIGIPAAAWTYAASSAGPDPYTAEMAIPWEKLAAAGLWKEQLLINVSVSGSSLTSLYTPVYLDAPRGLTATKRTHTVRLYFAEMEGKAPGQRVFNVNLQGQPVLKGLDVVKEAGGPKRELMKEFKGIAIADGLDIDFEATTGEAMLSGVEVIADKAARAHNTPPVAAIDASTLSGPAPLAVTLSAHKSQDPDGQIDECAWETGDGRLAKGSALQHVFTEAGTYKVHLLVRDNRGSSSAAGVTITVTPGEPAAFVCAIRAKDGDFTTLSAWETALRSDLTGKAGKSLLFPLKARGNSTVDDDGKAVTFSGGGTGTLRHVNGSNLAYISNCQGTIQAGTVTCASGHNFEIADAGHPIYNAVAECYNDWPGGLSDSVKSSGWTTDPVHCAIIRPKGQGHDGRAKNGFTLKGDIDAAALPFVRIERLVIDPASTLSAGPGASIDRILAGTVKLSENAMAANSIASTFAAGNSKNVVIQSVSSYTMNLRDAHKQARPPRLFPSNTGFYNCTAKTFDPGNQVEVAFVNCLAAPGGEGFRDVLYSEPGCAIHCVSADGTATIWDSGDGDEGNLANQTIGFVDAANGDFHLSPADKGAHTHGGPALGADVGGEERKGPEYDAGAAAISGKK
jgi:outer membrane protein assembly factor BamB/PKD repeat protein